MVGAGKRQYFLCSPTWPVSGPFVGPQLSPKKFMRVLFCVLSQEMRDINFFSGAPSQGFGWGATSLCWKCWCAFSVPYWSEVISDRGPSGNKISKITLDLVGPIRSRARSELFDRTFPIAANRETRTSIASVMQSGIFDRTSKVFTCRLSQFDCSCAPHLKFSRNSFMPVLHLGTMLFWSRIGSQ